MKITGHDIAQVMWESNISEDEARRRLNLVPEPARSDADSVRVQRMVRRIPVDFRAVAEEAGLKRGKLCHSPIFGWCVQNTHGDPGPDVATITAPELAPGEVRLAVEEGHWCFYAPSDQKSGTGSAGKAGLGEGAPAPSQFPALPG